MPSAERGQPNPAPLRKRRFVLADGRVVYVYSFTVGEVVATERSG